VSPKSVHYLIDDLLSGILVPPIVGIHGAVQMLKAKENEEEVL
jgi:hypothetical protein